MAASRSRLPDAWLTVVQKKAPVSFPTGAHSSKIIQKSFTVNRSDGGDFSAAEAALDTAIEHWIAANAYTHIFIRHPEIDSTSDAFYELKELLAEQNADGFPSAFDKLKYHLNSIDKMEHIRLGSVL